MICAAPARLTDVDFALRQVKKGRVNPRADSTPRPPDKEAEGCGCPGRCWPTQFASRRMGDRTRHSIGRKIGRRGSLVGTPPRKR
jgi:hypothetical protein